MPARSATHAVHLLYGNQPYLLEQRAAQLIESVLGKGEHDFTLHRFDAGELLRPGSADSLAAQLDAFEEACRSLPLLGERYLVRLDHAERLRAPSRGAQTLAKRVAELAVVPLTWEGAPAFALQAQLAPGEAGGEPVPVARWIGEVATRADGAALLTLAGDWEQAQFVVAARGGRHAMGLKPFLRTALKGSFAFAGDEEPDEEQGATPGPAPGGAASGGAAPRLLELVERLIEAPPPGLVLLLTAPVARERDFAKSLLDKAKRHGQIEKFVTYDDYAPWKWVQEQARAKGLQLDRPSADLLIRLAGNDHGRLAQEVEKLSLLFPAGTRLDVAKLAGSLHAGAHGSLFGINERLAARDLSGALAVLEQFLEESPNEFPVLVGVLARFFRQLLLVHAHSRHGVSDDDLAARLGVHPFIAKRIVDQAERFTPLELERIVQALAELDVVSRLHQHVAAPLFRDWAQGVCGGEFQRREPRLGLG